MIAVRAIVNPAASTKAAWIFKDALTVATCVNVRLVAAFLPVVCAVRFKRAVLLQVKVSAPAVAPSVLVN